MNHKPHYQVTDHSAKFTDTHLANLDLPPHLAGVLCSKCKQPMTRSKDGPISCKLDREGKPVCLRASCCG